MSADLQKPILIYMAKAGCPACQQFESEWKKLIQQLSKDYRLVKFLCDHAHPPPPALTKYFGWAPNIILAGPKSYYRVFTPEDTINEVDYNDSYVIKGQQCNAVETPSGIQPAGRPYTADYIMSWLNGARNRIHELDEPTPPMKYPQLG